MKKNYLIWIQSSIGRKIFMAMTGIFLMFFLLLHLSINLLLFYGEKSFNQAVFFMRNNIIIRGMEYFLALGFILHILIGIQLYIRNLKAKSKVEYTINYSLISFSSRNMIISGILILCFLILHLINFTIPIKYSRNLSDYDLVTSLFKNPLYTLIYIFSFIILGFHLNHGFQSSFQSLGLSKKNICWIQKLGFFYSWLICSGFSLIAIWFFFN